MKQIEPVFIYRIKIKDRNVLIGSHNEDDAQQIAIDFMRGEVYNDPEVTSCENLGELDALRIQVSEHLNQLYESSYVLCK